MTLFLVRHGRPLVRADRPAATWELDPDYLRDVVALRSRLPWDALWASSPEPKALGTARLLTDGPVAIVDDLREQVRESTGWIHDFPAVVAAAFAEPERSAHTGWEPLAQTRTRVVAAARRLVGAHDLAEGDVVLVGHGTAWALLIAELTARPPDLEAWAALRMPGLLRVTPGP